VTSTAHDMNVLILCGGLGTRLRPVLGNHPKSMADIRGRPLLHVLIKQTQKWGFKRFILCIGFQGHIIRQYFEEAQAFSGLTLLFSEEAEPLGTGGAIKNAEELITSDPFLVMNGDTLSELNIKEFINFHEQFEANLTIALTAKGDDSQYGNVRLDRSGRILSFREKKRSSSGYTSMGIYIFNKVILDCIPQGRPYSLEHDLFPNSLNMRCFGYTSNAVFKDIGTPERYRNIQKS